MVKIDGFNIYCKFYLTFRHILFVSVRMVTKANNFVDERSFLAITENKIQI